MAKNGEKQALLQGCSQGSRLGLGLDTSKLGLTLAPDEGSWAVALPAGGLPAGRPFRPAVNFNHQGLSGH